MPVWPDNDTGQVSDMDSRVQVDRKPKFSGSETEIEILGDDFGVNLSAAKPWIRHSSKDLIPNEQESRPDSGDRKGLLREVFDFPSLMGLDVLGRTDLERNLALKDRPTDDGNIHSQELGERIERGDTVVIDKEQPVAFPMPNSLIPLIGDLIPPNPIDLHCPGKLIQPDLKWITGWATTGQYGNGSVHS